ncbi:MAG: hypothetical protein JXR62_05520 [Bacilli bacterium]|nr:hypothetical protein [Bacilli bacterium]
MNEISQKQTYHLDNLRMKSKVPVSKLCEGICTERQYRRYLSGENHLPDSKIFQFCEKLRISPSDFYYSFNEKDRYEYKKIVDLYNMINKNELSEFNTKLMKISKRNLISTQNERFLTYCIEKFNFINKNSTPNMIMDKLSILADYPACINKSAFDFVDLISIQQIAEIEVGFKNERALNLLLKIMKSDDMMYISSESRHILPSIYANTSLLLGRLNKYNDSLEISSEGIKYSILHSNFGSLTHLRYIRSLSLLKLELRVEAEIEAMKCICNAISRESKSDLKIFFDVLKKDFGENPVNYFRKYLESLL